MTTHLVAVDPGLDAAGVALFDLRAHEVVRASDGTPVKVSYPDWIGRDSFADAVRRLSRYEVLRTSPEWALPVRLGWLARGIREVVPEGDVHVIIERSRIPGVYAQARARQQTKNAINAAALEKLFFAIGALVAGAHAQPNADVELIPASGIAKPLRKRAVLYELQQQGHPLGTRARVSPDLLDSIWLGAAFLSNPRNRRGPDSMRPAA